MKKLSLILGFAAVIGLTNPLSVQAKSISTYAGSSITDDSHYEYLGATQALNNNLKKDGFLVKAGVGYGEYKYAPAYGGKVSGDLWSFDALGGYQKYFAERNRVALFLGVNHENHNLSPADPNNPVEDARVGGKAQFELFLKPVKSISFNHVASYSTAFHTYFTDNMIGYDFGHAVIGPEVIVLGNKSFDQQRYGLSLADINIADVAKLRLSVGGLNTNRRGDGSYYTSAVISANF